MLDLLSDLSMGRELEAHGKTWLQIQYLRNNLYLAVEKGADLPAPVVMINCPPPQKDKAPDDQKDT